jgi:hypothetical protein
VLENAREKFGEDGDQIEPHGPRCVATSHPIVACSRTGHSPPRTRNCYNPPREGFAVFLAYSYSGAN